MSVAPSSALLDETSFSVAIRGLARGTMVTVEATAKDAHHVTWTSSARYRVPTDGTVTLAQAPVAGSYHGVDPMGLLLTMRPPATAMHDVFFVAPPAGYTVRLTARVGGSIVATRHALRRRPSSTEVRDTPLRPRADGVYGDLLIPATTAERRPGVVIFGGSEGGDQGVKAAGSLLAAHGYPTLALAYFGEPGLPRQLLDIPLEYFARAIRLLRAQPDVDPRHVLVYGASRGGEAALLLGATYPSEINGVIAGSPSATANGSYPAASGAAWTLGGKPITPGRAIAVEHIGGPILLACGTDDAVWPSCAAVAAVRTRLTAHHFHYPVTTLRFPDAGHFGGALTCCTSDVQWFGGTPSGNALAQVAGDRTLLALPRRAVTGRFG